MFRATRLLAAFVLLCGVASAQDKAVVVATCGTAPHTYVAGQIQPLVQNTDGEVCVTGAGGAGGAPADATYLTSSANATLSAEVVVPATGVAWLVTSGSSANLRAHLTDETGTGEAVFGTSPTFTTSILAPAGAVGTPAIQFGGDTTSGLYRRSANEVNIAVSGSEYLRMGSSSVTAIIGTIGFGSSGDLSLTRDGAANTLAQRNGVNAQTFRIYNTFTDASNYERGVISWTGNDLKIGTENAGTGAATRQLHIYGQGMIRFYTGSTPIQAWNISNAGHILAATDNTFDIGASGATRPRNLFVAGTITSGGTISSSGVAIGANVVVPATGILSWTGRSQITSNADGALALRDNAGTSFGLLQFGGTTSSFPALKRSTTVLQARLADDSAATNIEVLGEVYDATGWNGDLGVATKDDVRDHIEDRRIYFRAGMAGAQGGILDNAVTKLVFDSEQIDVGAKYDPTTNHEWCPGIAGQVTISVVIFNITATFTVGDLVFVTLYKGTTGAETATTMFSPAWQAATTAAAGGESATFIDTAGATDCYQARITSNTTGGGASSVSVSSFWQGTLIK